MAEKFRRVFNIIITFLLVFQFTGCGTLLYPERRGQVAGHLDAGVVILDAIGLLFFIIPGVIAFAVDFSNGTIYLPGRTVIGALDLKNIKEVKFNTKHTSLASIEGIIKDETGKVYLEIPVTFGVIGAIIAPLLAAVGAIAAMVANLKIEVIRSEDEKETEKKE